MSSGIDDTTEEDWSSSESPYWGAVKTARIRTFHHSTQAYVYSAALHEANLPHFLSNEVGSSLMFPPILAQGIGLHVRVQDRQRAQTLLLQLDEREKMEIVEDFREADLAEIQYQKSLHAAQKRISEPIGIWGWLSVLMVSVILVLYLARIV
jgi:hypothetical protein